MKLKMGNLSKYAKSNKRFVFLLLIVIVVIFYIATDIYAEFSNRNMGSESNEVESDLFSNNIISSKDSDVNETAVVNNGSTGNEQESYNIYLSDDSENKHPVNEVEPGVNSKGAIITKEDIDKLKESMAEREVDENDESEDSDEEAEYESDSRPEPKPEPKPEPEPEIPAVEVKNIELIVHIHFEDENGKSLSGEVVEINVSKSGGGSLGSALSDGEDARMSIPAVNCIISGQEVPGFVSEGGKAVSLSNEDSVKHVSYKYRKAVQ